MAVHSRGSGNRAYGARAFINEQGDKDFMNPSVISVLFVKKLRRLQIQVVSDSSLIFLAEFGPNIDSNILSKATEDIRDRLNTLLADKKMSNVTYEIRDIERLKVDPKTGKLRLIVISSQQ